MPTVILKSLKDLDKFVHDGNDKYSDVNRMFRTNSPTMKLSYSEIDDTMSDMENSGTDFVNKHQQNITGLSKLFWFNGLLYGTC